LVWCTIFVFGVFLPVSADGEQFERYIVPGLTLGLDEKMVLGGELSVNWLNDRFFAGVFSEAVYRREAEDTRLTLGGTVGYFLGSDRGYSLQVPVGMDLGTGLHLGSGEAGIGIRLFAFLGPLGLYGRYWIMFDGLDFPEFGLMLKWPF